MDNQAKKIIAGVVGVFGLLFTISRSRKGKSDGDVEIKVHHLSTSPYSTIKSSNPNMPYEVSIFQAYMEDNLHAGWVAKFRCGDSAWKEDRHSSGELRAFDSIPESISSANRQLGELGCWIPPVE